MARKLILQSSKAVAAPVADPPDMSAGPIQTETLDSVMRQMMEVMESYLETLTAEERENRLSR